MSKKTGADNPQDVLDGKVTVIKMADTEALKADRAFLGSNAFEVEDEFAGKYYGDGNKDSVIIAPPYNPRRLMELVPHNNTLNQCITAMEVNVDGTGFDIVRKNLDEEETEQDKAVKRFLLDFFEEPYPEQSLTTIRRALRRDIEITGNGYLEVMRNAKGEVKFVKHVPSVTMRICRLSAPVQVRKTLVRGSKKDSVLVTVRERSYVQMIGGKSVYFKQFNASQNLHKTTGKWTTEKLKAKDRATEIIHFTAVKDSNSPYGIPRWINQAPSVLGSRKAEEFNLDFFNSGGLPPVLITISGGQMVAETKKALETYLNGAKTGNRAAIVEAYSSGGSVTSAGGAVRIQVERFGSEKQNDSMFENYDGKCEARVRGSFRLPPMFVGKAQDYNYATAQASYMVAEAQVFAPERVEFDDIINVTLMRALDDGKYEFRSNPIKSNNVDAQLKALTIANGISEVPKGDIIHELNDAVGMTLEYDESLSSPSLPAAGEQGVDLTAGQETSKKSESSDVVRKQGDILSMVELVTDWAKVANNTHNFSVEKIESMANEIASMPENRRTVFYTMVASQVFPDMADDVEGAIELAECLAQSNACECRRH